MASISIKNLTVDFKIYGLNARSLKRKIVSQAMGGRISSGDHEITTVRALDNISLEVREGDRLGLTGHNGSGKTTLLRVLAGIYKPTYGSIEIHGSRNIILDPAAGIDPEASGYENIYLRGYILGMSRQEISGKISEIAETAQIGQFLSFPMKTYSAGMLARFAFAISIIKKPDILLMDEGISAGDAAFQKIVNHKMKELHGVAKILMLASHSTELLSMYCNKILTLKHGQIVT